MTTPPPTHPSATGMLAQGQGLTPHMSEIPLLLQTPTLEPNQVKGKPCWVGSQPHFPFPMPRSHVALRLPPLSPPQPTKLGLGALPGPLLGRESWLLQNKETGSSSPTLEGGMSARL